MIKSRFLKIRVNLDMFDDLCFNSMAWPTKCFEATKFLGNFIHGCNHDCHKILIWSL